MRPKQKKRDELHLQVKHSQDKKTYKDNIITALYLDGIVLKKIKGILARHKVPTQAFIEEDLNQIVFLELSKKSADEIINMYEDDPNRLLGLCVRIAVLKGVAKNGTEYPKQNITKFLTYLSNLSYDRKAGDSEFFLSLMIDEDTDLTDAEIEDKEKGDILAQLTEESSKTLDDYINSVTHKNQTYSSRFWLKATRKQEHIKLINELLTIKTDKQMINTEALEGIAFD